VPCKCEAQSETKTRLPSTAISEATIEPGYHEACGNWIPAAASDTAHCGAGRWFGRHSCHACSGCRLACGLVVCGL